MALILVIDMLKLKAIMSMCLSLILLCSFTDTVEVINAGVGGNTTADLLKGINQDVIDHSPDLVLLMIGTNDMVNSKKIISYSDFRINISQLISKLKSNNIDVILISPIPVDTIYLYERHNRDVFEESPNQRIQKVRDIMEAISIENRITFIDLYSIFLQLGIPTHNRDIFIRNIHNSGNRDGVHPTSYGYEFMSYVIFHKMLLHNSINNGMKIICYGDSITKGVHVKGSGTAIGETYPAYLSYLLNSYFSIK